MVKLNVIACGMLQSSSYTVGESRWLATPKRWRFVRGHDFHQYMGVASHLLSRWFFLLFSNRPLAVRMRSSRKWNKSNLQDGTGERFGLNAWGWKPRSQPAGGSSKVHHLKMLHDCSGTGCSGTPHLWEFATKMLSQRTLNMALWEPRLNNFPVFYPLNIMCPAISFF